MNVNKITSKENATLEILDDSNFKSCFQDLKFLLLEERDLGSFILKKKKIKKFHKMQYLRKKEKTISHFF